MGLGLFMKHSTLERNARYMKIIKVSNKKELDDAYSVRYTVFVDEQKVPPNLEIDEHEDEAAHFVLYDDTDKPIGAGRCRDVEGKIKVERIAVLSEARKKGAGQLIMDAIEDHARKNGYNVLKLNSQTHAEHFYNKLGYETVSDEFMDAGIPHVTMTKHI